VIPVALQIHFFSKNKNDAGYMQEPNRTLLKKNERMMGWEKFYRTERSSGPRPTKPDFDKSQKIKKNLQDKSIQGDTTVDKNSLNPIDHEPHVTEIPLPFKFATSSPRYALSFLLYAILLFVMHQCVLNQKKGILDPILIVAFFVVHFSIIVFAIQAHYIPNTVQYKKQIYKFPIFQLSIENKSKKNIESQSWVENKNEENIENHDKKFPWYSIRSIEISNDRNEVIGIFFWRSFLLLFINLFWFIVVHIISNFLFKKHIFINFLLLDRAN